MKTSITPTIFLILDGWGQASASEGNAVSLANTPNIDRLMQLPLQTRLLCSGRAVGLPDGYMGNSEVGHMNIGAGRIVYQDMTRIDLALEEGNFQKNKILTDTIAKVKKAGGTLHVMGLLSDGGVHSHISHIIALIKMGHESGVPVAVHAFMDGRDTDPNSGSSFIQQLLSALPTGCFLATMSGRYYAMDRDKRWERVNLAWDAIVHGKGNQAKDPIEALSSSYAEEITDEFIIPTVFSSSNASYSGISSGDGIIMCNFRADRIRQLAHCFSDTNFDGFERGTIPDISTIATMTSYEETLPLPVAFERQSLSNGLGEILSKTGLKQLRIAETEKYAHVTFFFNGGIEEPFSGEERILIPSPRDVATYDLKPEMSAVAVTDALLKEWENSTFDVAVCNFANMDMVGHTGNIPAAIKAIETVDMCLGRIREAVQSKCGILAVTADHGNAEEMLTPDHKVQTAHSKNPVAFILSGSGVEGKNLNMVKEGKLGDIAPTFLALWGLPIPEEMTGSILCEDA